MASLSVLTAASRVTRQSDAMNSYVNQSGWPTNLNVDATVAILKSETPNHLQMMTGSDDPVTRHKFMLPTHFTHAQISNTEHQSVQSTTQANAHVQDLHYNHARDINTCPGTGDVGDVFGVLKKQNEITASLFQQQQLAALPKRDIKVFDGDPFEYHAFTV